MTLLMRKNKAEKIKRLEKSIVTSAIRLWRIRNHGLYAIEKEAISELHGRCTALMAQR